MNDVTKDNITEVFMGNLGEDVNSRDREIMGNLAKHLHAFAKEENLTHGEWKMVSHLWEIQGNFGRGAERTCADV